MDDNILRKHILGGKKTERLVFAVTPEMKCAIEEIAKDRCTTVSSMLTQLATAEVMANKNIFEGKIEQ